MADETPVPMTMHKAVVAFITSLLSILAVLGYKTGWATPDLVEVVGTVVGALITGGATWWVSNKPKTP